MNELIAHITKVCQNDDQLAFKKLYQHFSPGLTSYATSLLHNIQQSEETEADVFVKL